MRIGIIGQPCIDEIVHLDAPPLTPPQAGGQQGGSRRHALGGILYVYAAMERMMNDAGTKDHFVPLTWLAEPDRPLLDPMLARFRHIDREAGLWHTDLPTNRVYLVYDERGERTANCPNILPTLTERELTPELISSLDALFINMMSGYDVSIGTLEAVLDRAKRRPYIHLDVHALVFAGLSVTGDDSASGYRYELRGVRDWKRWLRLVDSIQVNELEARWFGDPEVQSEEALLAYVQENRNALRPQSLIITRAERGATLYDAHRDKTHYVPIPMARVLEPTGSGDVFGAAYTYAIANGVAPADALQQAVEWATWNATLLTLDELLTAAR